VRLAFCVHSELACRGRPTPASCATRARRKHGSGWAGCRVLKTQHGDNTALIAREAGGGGTGATLARSGMGQGGGGAHSAATGAGAAASAGLAVPHFRQAELRAYWWSPHAGQSLNHSTGSHPDIHTATAVWHFLPSVLRPARPLTHRPPLQTQLPFPRATCPCPALRANKKRAHTSLLATAGRRPHGEHEDRGRHRSRRHQNHRRRRSHRHHRQSHPGRQRVPPPRRQVWECCTCGTQRCVRTGGRHMPGTPCTSPATTQAPPSPTHTTDGRTLCSYAENNGGNTVLAGKGQGTVPTQTRASAATHCNQA
jgi:hypothetical protein